MSTPKSIRYRGAVYTLASPTPNEAPTKEPRSVSSIKDESPQYADKIEKLKTKLMTDTRTVAEQARNEVKFLAATMSKNQKHLQANPKLYAEISTLSDQLSAAQYAAYLVIQALTFPEDAGKLSEALYPMIKWDLGN
jgi:hypothetical protein